jgi:hydroxymethylglutaryl-CoA synthase
MSSFVGLAVTRADLSYKATLSDKAVEKMFIALGKEDYAERVAPSLRCAARYGNMYMALLYGGLSSLLSTVEPQQLKGR